MLGNNSVHRSQNGIVHILNLNLFWTISDQNVLHNILALAVRYFPEMVFQEFCYRFLDIIYNRLKLIRMYESISFLYF